MGAPAEFVVLRHLLSHPSDSRYEVARHSGLSQNSVGLVVRRIEADEDWSEKQRLERLRNLKRRPTLREYRFRAPNPRNWHRQYDQPGWISGEVAAAELEKYSLVPERHLVYVKPEHRDAAIRAAFEVFAELAPPREANLMLREADPWLTADDSDPRYVERGQRLLDYAESRHIQILRELDSHA